MLRLALISDSPLVLAGLRAGLGELGQHEMVFAGAMPTDLPPALPQDCDVAIVEVGDEADFAADLFAGLPLVLLVGAQHGQLADWLADGHSVLPVNAGIEAIAAACEAAAAGLVTSVPAWLGEAVRFAGASGRLHAQALGEYASIEPLTSREREVLTKMALGLGNRQIAELLGISAHTAKFHVASIIAKLDATSRAHAVARALRAGLIDD